MEAPDKKRKSSKKSPEVKTFIAELAIALEELGVPRKTFVEATTKTSFPVKKSTLNRHIASIGAGQSPFSPEKNSGRKASLDEEQWSIVAGAILSATEVTTLQWVADWIRRNFGVVLSLMTVSRHVKELHLSIKLARHRGMPKGMNRDEYVKLYYDDVLKLHNTGFFLCEDKLIYTIDATSNSRRLERQRTIAMSGAPAPKLAKVGVVYTDTYLAALWKDGVNRTPTLMFTFNPALSEEGGRWEEVKEWCRAWGLETLQIVYKKSEKVYCATKSTHIAHFKRLYSRRLRGTHVMHDAGNEFKIDGEFILGDGAEREFVFTPATHGEASVLDNNWFAIAKNWWRTEREKFCGDDVDKQSVYLLYCIDYYKSKQIQDLYNRNFLLGGVQPTLVAVDKLLNKSTTLTFENQELMDKYLDTYGQWCRENNVEDPLSPLDALDVGLDGPYWE